MNQVPGLAGVMSSNPFLLIDAQMERLKPFFSKRHGKLRVDDRRVPSGIIFISLAQVSCLERHGDDPPRLDGGIPDWHLLAHGVVFRLPDQHERPRQSRVSLGILW